MADPQAPKIPQLEDVAWLQGRFDAKGPLRARWSALVDWAHSRASSRTAAVRTQLEAAGVPTKGLEIRCYGDDACVQILSLDHAAKQAPDWKTFARRAAEARAVFAGYRAAVDSIERIESAEAGKENLSHRLHAASLTDEAYRSLLAGDEAFARLPLSVGGRSVFRAWAAVEASRRDHRNAAFLKQYVDAKGWPRRAVVGAQSAGEAWLIVQHADDDPLFQFQALRLMEPLVATHEVDGADYAYLYDRVAVATSGLQRYGTQLECDGHKISPSAQEDPLRTDALRGAIGLEPLAAYLAEMKSQC